MERAAAEAARIAALGRVEPSLFLGRSRVQLGRWDPALRSIEVSEPLLLEQGWGAAVEVLTHYFRYAANLRRLRGR